MLIFLLHFELESTELRMLEDSRPSQRFYDIVHGGHHKVWLTTLNEVIT
jgi:hypothetical protein